MDGDAYKKVISAHGWSGLALADYLPLLSEGDPLPRLLSHPHSVLRDLWGVSTCAVELPQGAVIVRHDQRPRRRWFTTRSMHTLRIHRRLRAAGIHVPRVIAALRRRGDGGRLEELVLTEKLDAVDLVRYLRSTSAADAPKLRQLLTDVGRLFRVMHDAGFIHGDPIPGNMLVCRDGRLALIDNERTRHLGNLGYFFHRERRKNLMRLLARAGPQNYRVARCALAGYYGTGDLPPRGRVRAEWLAIVRMAHRRRRWLRELHRVNRAKRAAAAAEVSRTIR